jgi:hypothetical protein
MKNLFFRNIYQSNPEITAITKIYTLSLKFLVMRKLRLKTCFFDHVEPNAKYVESYFPLQYDSFLGFITNFIYC